MGHCVSLATKRQLREAIADQIRNVFDGGDLDVQVEPRFCLEPTPPTIDVYSAPFARDPDSAGFGDISGAYLFTVRARIGTAAYDETYDWLEETMDDASDISLAAALLDDPTLNGYASDLDVRDVNGLRAFEHPSGDGALLGWSFTAFVLPAQS